MSRDLRILLLEDEPADAELIEHELRCSGIRFSVQRVGTRHDFIAALSPCRPDAILSDVGPPGFHAMEPLGLAGEYASTIPVIIVTDQLSAETAVECMKQGAWDCITRDRLARLAPAITAALEKKRVRDETDRENEALARSRDFYLNIFEVSPALIWRADPDGRFDYFNRNWLEFSGRPLEEHSVSDWCDMVHPDDARELRRALRHAFTARIPFETEYRLRRHDGEYRWIQNFGRPFSDQQGRFAGFIGYCLDRTDSYETEEVLHKLSRAVEQSTSAIVITDTEGRIEYANRSYALMTGYALEDIIGRNPLTEAREGNLPDLFGDAWDSLREKGEWRGERQCRNKRGEFYWESAAFTPIMNSDDVITHYLVEEEDITARKLTERELRKSRAELLSKHEELQNLFNRVELIKKEWENTLDCIDDMVAVADREGRIVRCNRAFREFAGLGFDSILGSDWRSCVSARSLQLPDDVSAGVEIRCEGTDRWYFCRTYPFLDDTGREVAGSILTIHDLTERKKVTDELERAYSELKATQAKVVQQEKMASIGQLAAGVAHEINNPMGFISSNLGTLGKYLERLSEYIDFLSGAAVSGSFEGIAFKKKSLKVDYVLEDGRDLIAESLEGAERVRTIVRNLKSFSRVDESQYKAADINECLESTINIVWNELKYKASLERELGDIPLVSCNPQEINQVFMNLLVNASQAIEKQGEIRVRTWHDAEAVFAAVSDTGCGIPESVRNRIFEPFFTTKEVGKGTGLGLSITYDIIKKHRGDISVESEPGAGSTFTVRLPLVP